MTYVLGTASGQPVLASPTLHTASCRHDDQQISLIYSCYSLEILGVM